jgi:hypothetical protein
MREAAGNQKVLMKVAAEPGYAHGRTTKALIASFVGEQAGYDISGRPERFRSTRSGAAASRAIKLEI